MTEAEVKEINDRIANLRSSQKDIGCEYCESGMTFMNTGEWGIVFIPCRHCNEKVRDD